MANAEGIGTMYVDTTGTLVSTPVRVRKVHVHSDTAQAITLVLRDNGATGVIQIKLRNDNDVTLVYDFDPPIVFNTNLHATITGTGAEALVYFERIV